ncbi:hypothetical protein [Caballeronia sp. INDeC2]|uniref:hypothetical protein n=1 Tax=Caballeronia sp. INDeC2 TaxID=2921747 RepID=UPI00202869CB|nr:hypothetical protein [Caballeronia sp. INDeC2]
MIRQGKTGTIHGIEVKARSHRQQPTVEINTRTSEGRRKVIDAAKFVLEQHHDVFRALAFR